MNWWKALLSAFLFGVATPFSKELLEDASPFLLAALFYLGASLVLLPRSIYLQRTTPLRHITRKDLANLIGSLFFGGMVGPLFLLFGLKYTEATSGSLLLNLETPATTILAFIFFKENIGIRSFIANAGIVLAGIILTFQGTFTPGIGGILIALACIAWGMDNNHTASIHDIDPVRCTFLKGVTFGIVNLLIAISFIETWPTLRSVFIALLIGAFSYGLSIVLYISSARNLGAARSQMFFATAPFWGVLVSQFYLHEDFQAYQIISMVLLCGMLFLIFTEKHAHLHSHEPFEHAHRHRHDDKHHHHRHEDNSEQKDLHTHQHVHAKIIHEHPHLPDLHHRHDHSEKANPELLSTNENSQHTE